ncbi:hypothetical protein PCANC_21001 [Puccinia coronata f. sp. avenae]|uniref:Uncharacterized protein n=1 Tax=Puccinia coronata f. sp. avenae TaxID=200324 RepID=A0A2N5U6F9_9BASI|nr:hypothetical protein PCANC_21001 [Puccinia coronata f. sp. avenae]
MSTQSKSMAHANDGDQKSLSNQEIHDSRYEAGQLHSHLGNDPKDQRSIANRLESELKKKEDDGFNPDPNIPNKGQKPTDLAKEHGHQPSRGAEIDEQIREEEEAELRKKGIKP